MNIIFEIQYHTVWGQVLYVTGSASALGHNNPDQAVAMRYGGNDKWTLSLDIPESEFPLTYQYIVKEYDQLYAIEQGSKRLIEHNSHVLTYQCIDQWQDHQSDTPFFSSAFTQVVFRHEQKHSKQHKNKANKAILLKLLAPTVSPNHQIAVVGDAPVLGSWNPEKALLLSNKNAPEWEIEFDASNLQRPIPYKFIILDKSNGQLLGWEPGENRILDIEDMFPLSIRCYNGLVFKDPLPHWRGSGVAIPMFSLRTEKSSGIGEILDLIPMIDWAEKTQQRVIQLLPINDTTMSHKFTDSYPYNANSSFALHPLYLRLSDLGKLSTDEEARFQPLFEQLNKLDQVDYEQVDSLKWEYFHLAYKQHGKKTMNSLGFHTFFQENKKWLIPYAAYCYLREKYKTPDSSKWEEFSKYKAKEIETLVEPSAKQFSEIGIHYFLQYHLDKQMAHVREYARKKGVILKGDIPIGISRHSVEAWTLPKLFNLNSQAGAPPDEFSTTGQNWGFPTYNWEQMASNNYTWWKNRFSHMAHYFDAYRIDHILGFFRIWEIPIHAVDGLLGYFHPALPFSVEEIQNYGFYFDPSRHTFPQIRHYQIIELFGDQTEHIIQNYLIDKGHMTYELKPEFTTQRKIEKYLSQKPEDMLLQDKLFSLVSDVLFIADPYEKGHYHPRIAAHQTYAYRSLNDYEKSCFDRMYINFYYHRHNQFWADSAYRKLKPLLSATSMLACGEDLGMIPACVPEVMHQFQILSLEIQQMPKNPHVQFGETEHYPYLSVCTTSTHDMSNFRAWWEENPSLRQNFYNHVLHQEGEAPFYAEPWICEIVLRKHLESPSMFTILPLQDWLSMDGSLRRKNPFEERINVPSNPLNYWRYRMDMTIESLLNQTEFNLKIKEMVKYSGRN